MSFRWRGRRYEVRAVLAHWVEATAWWGEQRGSSLGSSSGWAPSRRVIWRVEAVTRTGMAGAYDLAASAEGWQLLQVMD